MRAVDPVRWCASLEEAAEGRTAAWITTGAEASAILGGELEPTRSDRRDVGARQGDDARRFLGRRSTLRRLIGLWCSMPAETVVIGYGAAGRPEVLVPVNGPRCSVAARGDRAAFALSPHPVGIDIEPLIDGEIPWAVLGAAEAAALRRLGQAEQLAAFLEIWTVKEAYLKARGSGLLRDPAELSVSMAEKLLVDRGRPCRLAASILRRLRVGEQACIAACVGLTSS